MNVRVKRFQYHITQQWKSWLHLQVLTSWIPHIFFILTLRCTLVVICRHQDWHSFVTSRRQRRFWRPPEISCTSFSVVTSALTGKVSVLPTNPLSEVNVIFSHILIYRVSVLFIDDRWPYIYVNSLFERSGNNYTVVFGGLGHWCVLIFQDVAETSVPRQGRWCRRTSPRTTPTTPTVSGWSPWRRPRGWCWPSWTLTWRAPPTVPTTTWPYVLCLKLGAKNSF